MKPILLTISVLIFSLANTSLEIAKSTKIEDPNFVSEQYRVYTNQDIHFTSKEIILAGCTSCHMAYSPNGRPLTNMLNENFDIDLMVHKISDPKYLEGLEDFLATHNEEEAEAKYVDYQKVEEYLANY